MDPNDDALEEEDTEQLRENLRRYDSAIRLFSTFAVIFVFFSMMSLILPITDAMLPDRVGDADEEDAQVPQFSAGGTFFALGYVI